ncbi:MAG: squalene/phytoene synthase family protein [Leptolyngbyaceae cyanobacterium]
MTNSNVRVVASAEYRAISDDTLKDQDNGLWLSCFSAEVQGVWLQRFSWLRRLDRLAEQDQLIAPGGRQFPDFQVGWRQLFQARCWVPACGQWDILDEIYHHWLSPAGDCEAELQGWNRYVEAMANYHRPVLALKTLQDHDNMLDWLAGSCFQFLPDLHPEDRSLARYFGMVDQCYNNLRDLHEDACQGICYFPEALLSRFQLSSTEILNFTCFENPGYYRLMAFWLMDYLPQLQNRAMGLICSDRLPRTWQYLLAWFIHRYRRIERVMVACDYNFVQFAHIHRAVVQHELRLHANQSVATLSHDLSGQYDLMRALALSGQSPFAAPSTLGSPWPCCDWRAIA